MLKVRARSRTTIDMHGSQPDVSACQFSYTQIYTESCVKELDQLGLSQSSSRSQQISSNIAPSLPHA